MWILILLLFSSAAWGADVCPECQIEPIIDDVSGGLATSIPAHKLANSYSPDMRNVMIDDNKIEQIAGFVQVGSTPTLMNGRGGFPYYKENGQTSFLVTDSSIVLETSDFRSYVMVSSGHNTGVLMRCSQIYNDMWCSNGVDSVFKWDGSVKTVLDGTKGTPNVPKGKFFTMYLERVWMFNLPSDASGVRYSDVRSTNGVIISPDNFLAWPVGNGLHVGQGDGQNGSAIWTEKGRLKFGKDRSIYTLFGTNASNFQPVITNSEVGVASHDSLVILDNQSHFVGHNGIYRDEQRKSDLISDETNLIDKSSIRTVANAWETQSDFARGQFYGTTATAIGLLQPVVKSNPGGESNAKSPSNTFFSESPGAFGGLSDSTTFYGWTRKGFSTQIDSGAIVFVQTAFVNLGVSAACTVCPNVRVTLRNMNTGIEASTTTKVDGNPAGAVLFNFQDFQHPLFENWEVTSASFAIKLEFANFADTPQDVTGTSADSFVFLPATTGQFLSEVSTITSVTAWGNFESIFNTNGGSVRHYIRTSTSAVNITTQVWQNITPGVRINAPTINNYVQWASTIQSVSTFTNVSNIDNVEIIHIEGAGAVNRAFGIAWLGRYWLFFSTSADSVSSSILVKSKITNKNPDAWMPMSGINIRSVFKDQENTFYGGSSSAPIFYRLDYGTNFDGAAIESYYVTPSVSFDSEFKEKTLYEYYLVANRNPGSSFTLGEAFDNGAYTNTNYSLSGSGILNRVIQNPQAKKGKFFRWKFSHSMLDDPFVLHNFAAVYQPTGVRKGKDE